MVHFGWLNHVDQPGGPLNAPLHGSLWLIQPCWSTRGGHVNAPLHGSFWLIQPCWATRGDPCKRAFTRFTLVDSTVLINPEGPCKRALRLYQAGQFEVRSNMITLPCTACSIKTRYQEEARNARFLRNVLRLQNMLKSVTKYFRYFSFLFSVISAVQWYLG